MNEQKNIFTGVVLVAALLGGLYLLSRQNNQTVVTVEETSTPTTEEIVVEETTDSDEEDVTVIREFEVRAQGFSFTPTEIVVNKGDAVRIKFINDGGMHDWVVDEFDARTEVIQTGETDEVEFVADTAGTFEFYCSVMNHRAMGMVGTLVVEETLE